MRIDQLPVASSINNNNTLPVNVNGATVQASIGSLTNAIRDNVYGAPLTAATSSAMTDQTKVYVYTGTTSGSYTNGHWYYYNGSAWTDGGVYNSSAVQTDPTLTLEGVPADAKATGDAIGYINTDLYPMLEIEYIIQPTEIWGNNNSAMTSNNDGSFVAGTTDYGNTTFKPMTTLEPGDYYLYGVQAGIAFLTTQSAAASSYSNRIVENTSPAPKRFHIDNSVSVCLGYRIASKPSSAVTIYPTLYRYVPKVDRALLQQSFMADGTDLNSVTAPGIYYLNSTYSYTNAPDFKTGSFLEVLKIGNIVAQIAYQYGTNTRTYTPNIAFRFGASSGITSVWKYIGRKYGIRAGFIGDSIIWGRNGNAQSSSDANYRTTYLIPDAIAHNLGIACDNLGVSGMGWMRQGTNTIGGTADTRAYDLLSSLTLSDYDCLIFALGVNDGFFPLGTWDSTDETTIMGQFNKCIQYIMQNSPRMRVIIIAPINGTGIGSFPDYWYGPRENTNGYVSRKVLSDTLKIACDYYWIPYIEQYDGPINPYSIQSFIGSDGVHPSNSGYIALGQWLSSKIGALL